MSNTEKSLRALNSDLFNYIAESLDKVGNKDFPSLIEASLIQEYINIAFADVSEFISVDKENNIKVKNLKKLPSGASCAIKEVSQCGNKVTIKMHDKKSALDFIARYFGIVSCDLSEGDIEKRIFELLGKAGIIKETKRVSQKRSKN